MLTSKIRDMMTSGVIVRPAFIIDNFLPEEDFQELKRLVQSNNYQSLEFSDIMNKYEETVDIGGDIPKKVDELAKKYFQSDTLIPAYHMFAHHEVTENGDIPLLPLHLDESPGTYVVDLIIDYSVEWPIVVDKQVFTPKPNQAVLFYAEDQMHYRPEWPGKSPDDFYQAIFFHYTEPNHWCKTLGWPHRDTPEAREFFIEKRNRAFKKFYTTGVDVKSLPPIPEPKTYTDI